MKLVMKADDGKEIVYLSDENYELGFMKEMENYLIIDISRSPDKLKEFLFSSKNKNNSIDLFKLRKKDDEVILETSDYYYVFSEKLTNAINQISEDLKLNEFMSMAIAYSEDIKNQKERQWCSLEIGRIINSNI